MHPTNYISIAFSGATYLVVRKRAILINSIDPSHTGAYRFSFQYSLLFTLGEQGDIIVNIFQNDVDSSLTSQLLDSIILFFFNKGETIMIRERQKRL